MKRTHFRSEYIDKQAQKAHRRTQTFPELDNLTSIQIEVHGFRGREEKISWEKVEKMLEGSKL